MSIALPSRFTTRSGLVPNPCPQRQDGFDEPATTRWLAEAAGTPQPMPHAAAAPTHPEISSPSGAARAFGVLWQGQVAAEPELLE